MQRNIHANRMVLMKLRKRLGTAKRGHTLLKHKLDELLHIYRIRHEDYNQIKITVKKELNFLYTSFILGSGMLRDQFEYTLLASPVIHTTMEEKSERLLNLKIPAFEIHSDPDIPPYALDETNSDLDHAVKKLNDVIPFLIQLAGLQRQIELLTREMRVTRRRVNALEYLLIPQIQSQIRFIQMKLEEVERDNINRLMRIKEIIQKQNN